MKGRVIFIGTCYFPSEQELRELRAIQERLHYYRVEFLNSVKRLSAWERTMCEERLKNRTRELIRVISTIQNEEHC